MKFNLCSIIFISAVICTACGGGSSDTEPPPMQETPDSANDAMTDEVISLTPLIKGSNPAGMPQSVGDWTLQASYCATEAEVCDVGPLFASDENGVLALYKESPGVDEYAVQVIEGEPPTSFPNLRSNISQYRPNEFTGVTLGNDGYDLLTGTEILKPAGAHVVDVTLDRAQIIQMNLLNNDLKNNINFIYDNGAAITFDGLVIGGGDEFDITEHGLFRCGFSSGNQNFTVYASSLGDIFLLNINSTEADSFSFIGTFNRSVRRSCSNTLYGKVFVSNTILPDGTDAVVEILDDSVVRTTNNRFLSGPASFLGYLVTEQEFDAREAEIIMGDLTVEAPPYSERMASTTDRIYVMAQNRENNRAIEIWSAPVSY